MSILQVILLGVIGFFLPHFISLEVVMKYLSSSSPQIMDDAYLMIQLTLFFVISITSVFFVKIEKSKEKKFNFYSFLVILFGFLSFLLFFNIAYESVCFYFFNDHFKLLYSELTTVIPTSDGDVDWVSFGGSILLFCVLVPICEEVFFRRVIFQLLIINHGFLLSSVVSSVIFGLYHNVFFIPFLISIALSFIYQKFGLVGSIATHAIYNLLVLLVHLVYFKIHDYHLTMASELNTKTVVPMIVSALLLSLCLVLYRRHPLMQKL